MPTRRLVVTNDGSGPFFLLIDGDSVTVGGATADGATVLQPLRVANVHCVLEVEADHVTVRNEQPGADNAPRELRPGEVVRADGSQLLLQAPAAAPGPDEDAGLLPVDGPPASAPPTPAPPPPGGGGAGVGAPAPAAAPSGLGPRLKKRLVVIDGADQGQIFTLPEVGTMTLGKDRKHADIILHDLYVARAHCRLKIVGEKVEVVDADGHGTQVNGKKINRHEMGMGDVLRVGNSHLRLEAAVAGEEFAKVAGHAAPAADDEPIELTVEEEGDADYEEVEDDVAEEAPEPLPAGASEPARLLYLWRDKLAQLSGQTFGHYKLGPVLGRGRHGVIFQAEDTKTGQALALKVFSPQFPQGNEELQKFAAVMKSTLPLRHPHLVALLGAGKTSTYTWVAREFVEGEALAGVIRRLAKAERGDERRACRVAAHVGRALEFARQHRLRHGRVNPANILVRKAGQVVKLADLMLGAVLEGSQLERAALEHRPASELGYLSPEQVTPGAFVDESSDVYGLGAVVYALLTGRPPFVGDKAEEVLKQVRTSARVPRPSALNPEVSPALEQVVMKMLARRQEDRYHAPAEMLADLKPIAAEQGIEV
jgi:hypothetical protein